MVLETQDSKKAACAAGLVYVTDSQPGISRRRVGKGFTFIDTDGKRVLAEKDIKRLKSLAIPPAWEEVWICAKPNGHLQATGRDARRRKQYRYHTRWREIRDAVKFERLLAFGEALPRLRAAVDELIRGEPLERQTVVATVIRLLEKTLIRVGNDAYTRSNKTYGLTTLRERHANVDGKELCFEFLGKGGKRRRVSLKDKQAARVVKALHELPGQDLFQYLDKDGKHQKIGSTDVNDFIQSVAGDDFTAKDFRTWAATVLAAWALYDLGQATNQTLRKRKLIQAVEQVASHLGNTSAVCRKSYIHPAILDAYLAGEIIDPTRKRMGRGVSTEVRGLEIKEKVVWLFLHRRSGTGD